MNRVCDDRELVGRFGRVEFREDVGQELVVNLQGRSDGVFAEVEQAGAFLVPGFWFLVPRAKNEEPRTRNGPVNGHLYGKVQVRGVVRRAEPGVAQGDVAGERVAPALDFGEEGRREERKDKVLRTKDKASRKRGSPKSDFVISTFPFPLCFVLCPFHFPPRPCRSCSGASGSHRPRTPRGSA